MSERAHIVRGAMFAIVSEELEAAEACSSSTASGDAARCLALPPRALENLEPMEGGESSEERNGEEDERKGG